MKLCTALHSKEPPILCKHTGYCGTILPATYMYEMGQCLQCCGEGEQNFVGNLRRVYL